MTRPRTKAELLAHMRKSHDDFQALLSGIPAERTDEVALYDNWSIKDFIAHISWWANTAAERMAAVLRGQHPDLPHGTVTLNAAIQEQYRSMSLDDVRAMEHRSFKALAQQVESASEYDIFELNPSATSYDNLLDWIADNSYAHYDEHLPDVRAWMRHNGLD